MKLKKVIAIVLTFAMTLGMLSMNAFAENMPNDLEEVIVEGEAKSVTLEAGEEKSFKFTPATTGGYAFYQYLEEQESGKWFSFTLYDSDGNQIAEENVYGESYKLEAILQEEETYILVVCFSSSYDSGTFKIIVESGANALRAYADKNTTSNSREYSIEEDETITLSPYVTAVDMDGITYTWYKNYVEIPDCSADSILVFGTDKNVYYRCDVSDKYGNNQSVYYYVNYNNAISAISYIDNQENNTIYAEKNSDHTLEVVAESKYSDSFTYKWFKSGSELTGENENTILINAGENYTQYRCEISDEYNNTTTRYFYIYIKNLEVYPSTEEITNNTLYLNANVGDTITLSPYVISDDITNLSYQWEYEKYNSREGYYTWDYISGATDSSYTIENINQSENIACTVQDNYGTSKTVYYYITVDNNLKVYAGTDDYGNKTISKNVLVPYNESTTLTPEVTANDMDGITYEWSKHDATNYKYNKIYGATASTLTLNKVSQFGEYRCRVVDKYGNSENAYYYVKVDNGFNAYAGRNSYGTLTSNLDVYVQKNGSTTLTPIVEANNMEGITYKWYKDGRLLADEDYNFITVSNVNKKIYYECDIIDAYGNKAYVYYNVNVDNNFSAYAGEQYGDYTEYLNLYAEINDTITLEPIVFADDKEGMQYQWYGSKLSPQGYYTSEKIEGATNSTYTINNINKGADYHCEIVDKYGDNKTVYYYISIDNGLNVYAGTDTYGYSSSIDIYSRIGDSITLKPIVEAYDTTDIKYEWTKDYIKIENVEDHLDINNIEKAAVYNCIVTDKYGNSGSAYYYIKIDNGFSAYTSQDSGNTYETINSVIGANIKLQPVVDAIDKEGITYQWRKDYLPLDITTPYLEINNLEGSEDYTCVVKDKYGNETQLSYNIRVNNFSVKNITYNYAKEGENVALHVDVTANDKSKLNFSWMTREGKVIESGKDCDTITVEVKSENQAFNCNVSDGYGNTAYTSIYACPLTELQINGNEYERIDINPGEEKELEVNVLSPIENPQITYQWYYKDSAENRGIMGGGGGSILDPVKLGYEIMPDETSSKLKINAKNAEYICIVSDGKISKGKLFTVYPQTNLDVKAVGPWQKSVKPGEGVTLQVEATSSYGQIKYQWYKSTSNGIMGSSDPELIKGETTNQLKLLTAVSGSYICQVSDDYCSVKVAFLINVETDLAAKAVKQNIDSNVGESGTLEVVASSSHGPIKYQWYKNEFNSEKNTNMVAIDGANSAKLEISNIQSSGNYYCEVADKYAASSIRFQVNAFGQTAKTKDEAVEIKAGENALATIKKYGSSMYFVFEPETSGVYKFEADNLMSSKTVSILDENLNVIKRNEYMGVGASVSATLKANNKYYLKTSFYDGRTKGSYFVKLSKEDTCSSGHTLSAVAAKVATCKEDGNTKYWECSQCGKFFKDSTGKVEIEKDSWIVKATGHKHIVHLESKKATQTVAGNIDCYVCEDCKTHFSDESGLVELDESEWAIPATGASEIKDIADDETIDAGNVKEALSEVFKESGVKESLNNLLTSENKETSQKTREALEKIEEKFDVKTTIENKAEQESVQVDNAVGMALNDASKLTVGDANKETFEKIKEQEDVKDLDVDNGVPFSMNLEDSKENQITEIEIPMVIKIKVPNRVSTEGLRVIQIHGDETIVHVPQIVEENGITYAIIVVTGFSDFMFANIESVNYIKGDVNNDGVIGAEDVTALARHIANLSIITDENILTYCCDTNGDGIVDAADVTHLARFIANLISEL